MSRFSNIRFGNLPIYLFQTHTLFVDAFLQNNRLDHVSQVMGYHPSYLEQFLKTQNYILRGDGPLPFDYRHFIAIMVTITTVTPIFTYLIVGILKVVMVRDATFRFVWYLCLFTCYIVDGDYLRKLTCRDWFMLQRFTVRYGDTCRTSFVSRRPRTVSLVVSRLFSSYWICCFFLTN